MSLIITHTWTNHHAESTIVFISGWGIDHRIFPAHLFSQHNSLSISLDDPFNHEAIIDLVNHYRINSMYLIGHSMGAHIVNNLLNSHDLSPIKTILIGIKPAYDPKILDFISSALTTNTKAFMHAFYKDCFFSKQEWNLFKNQILPLRMFSEEILSHQLTFLREQLFTISKYNLLFLHGTEDKIAPLPEIKELYPNIEVIEHCGHCPFFNTDFESRLNHLLI